MQRYLSRLYFFKKRFILESEWGRFRGREFQADSTLSMEPDLTTEITPQAKTGHKWGQNQKSVLK